MIRVIEKLKAVNNGGIEAFVFNNTFLIRNTGIEIAYYTDKAPAALKYTEELTAAGRQLFISPSDNKRNGRVTGKMQLCAGFYKFCRENNVEAVHIHMSSPIDFMEGAAAGAAGVKKVILHSHSGERPGSGAVKKLVFALCRLMMNTGRYRLLACSEMAGRFMYGARSRFTVVKNGIDTAQFGFDADVRKQLRAKLGIDGKFVVGHVGRLAKIKNHCFLADIFRCILQLNSQSILLMAGEGEYREKIEEHINALGISDRVIFTGSVNDPAPYLWAMDAFVLPSLSEGISIAAIEAQTAGLKTICSDGVPKEAAVTELCSFMPLKASPTEWAEHIISECDGYDRRSYEKEVRAAGYDIAETAKQLENIYLSLSEE